MRPVLDILYSWLSSEAFLVVSPDLETLAHKIMMILDNRGYWTMHSLPSMRFYSAAYQCYFHSLSGSGKRSENDVLPGLGRLILRSLSLHLISCIFDSHYPHFSINGLFQVMLLLIEEHNESILYEWA